MKKIGLIVFFLALLSVPFLFKRDPTLRTVERDTQAVIASHGVFYAEVTKEVGIDFRHSSPSLDSKLNNIMPIVASMGAGVSVVDFDRDGWNDLYFTNSGEDSLNSLYRNNRDGTFTDVAPQMNVADINRRGTGVSMGAVWGDYDNDGFDDLFVYKWGRAELFHNDSGKSFTRTTSGSGLPAWANVNTAIWLDYDRDGQLDLFVGGYFREDLDLWKLENTLIMPESFEYAKNGGRKYLFHNLGGGKFEEVSKKVGVDSTRWSLAAISADLNGDGFSDLFVANDYGISELYLNDNGMRFIDAGDSSGVGFAPKSGMSASVGDVLNSGKHAIYVSNISEEGILLQGNNLWVQSPKQGELKFVNQASSLGVEMGGWSWGAQFGDLNNDGNQDLFLTNGFISAETATNYWYDYSKITVGNDTIIGNATNWAPIGRRSLAGYQTKKVWLNDGAGRFNEVAQIVGVVETFDGRAVALADLWNRGVLDVIVANQNSHALIYKSTVEAANRWLAINLECTTSNRSCIGARARIFWNSQQQVQEVSGGSGFAAQNQRRLHFGLGKNDVVEKIEIRWPSGKIQVIEKPEPNRLHKLKEDQ